MERLLLASAAMVCIAGPAHAVPAAGSAAAPAAEDVDWSGFYIGVAAGYDYGKTTVTDLDGYNGPPPIVYNPRGSGIGLQGDYNWWFAPNWLLGAEAEAGYFGFEGHRQYPPYFGVRGPSDSVALIDGGLVSGQNHSSLPAL